MIKRLLLVLVVAAIAAAGHGGDDDAVVSVTGPPVTVAVERLATLPDEFQARDVVVTGTVGRLVPAPSGRQAFLMGEVVVVASDAAGVADGARVTVTDNARRLDAEGIDELADITGCDTSALRRYGGRMVVMATDVVAAG